MTATPATAIASRFVPLDTIRIDGGTQPRAEIGEAMVQEYAEAMRNGAEFPPVIIFFDGTERWLADGFHRYHAARKLQAANLAAEVRVGTRRDAILYSVGANAAHGMRRTNADKRKAVETLLADDEWKQWSDSEIGRHCGVSHELVRTLRPKPSLAAAASETRRVRTKHGTETTMKTGAIGKSGGNGTPKHEAIVAAIEADPHAPDTMIAGRVGVTNTYVAKVRKGLGAPSTRSKILQKQGTTQRIEKFSAGMNSLHGFVLGLQNLPAKELAADPRAPRWIEQLTELIHALRATRKAIGGPS